MVEMKRVASIDIGTNTILLLIAKVEDGKIHPLFEIETVAHQSETVKFLLAVLDRQFHRRPRSPARLNLCQSWRKRLSGTYLSCGMHAMKHIYPFGLWEKSYKFKIVAFEPW